MLANYTIALQHRELHDHAGDGVGDAAAAGKIYGAVDPALTGTLSGFLRGRRRDGDLQPRGRRDRGGRPLHDHRDVQPGGGAGNYTITYNTAELHDHHGDGIGDARSGEQDLRRG